MSRLLVRKAGRAALLGVSWALTLSVGSAFAAPPGASDGLLYLEAEAPGGACRWQLFEPRVQASRPCLRSAACPHPEDVLFDVTQNSLYFLAAGSLLQHRPGDSTPRVIAAAPPVPKALFEARRLWIDGASRRLRYGVLIDTQQSAGALPGSFVKFLWYELREDGWHELESLRNYWESEAGAPQIPDQVRKSQRPGLVPLGDLLDAARCTARRCAFTGPAELRRRVAAGLAEEERPGSMTFGRATLYFGLGRGDTWHAVPPLYLRTAVAPAGPVAGVTQLRPFGLSVHSRFLLLSEEFSGAGPILFADDRAAPLFAQPQAITSVWLPLRSFCAASQP